MTRKQALEVVKLAKPNNTVLEKLGWKWKAEIGEWCIDTAGELRLISRLDVDGSPQRNTWHGYEYIDEPIPILHWEEIERVLEGMGYYISFTSDVWANYGVLIAQNRHDIDKAVLGKGESRQEAMMRATIQLEKKRS